MDKVLITDPLNTTMYGVYLYSGEYVQAIGATAEKVAVLSAVPTSPGSYDADLISNGSKLPRPDNERIVPVTFQPVETGHIMDTASMTVNPVYEFGVDGYGLEERYVSMLPAPLEFHKIDIAPPVYRELELKPVGGKILLDYDRLIITGGIEMVLLDGEGYALTDSEGYVLTAPFEGAENLFNIESVSGVLLEPGRKASEGVTYYLHSDGTINDRSTDAVAAIAVGLSSGKWKMEA